MVFHRVAEHALVTGALGSPAIGRLDLASWAVSTPGRCRVTALMPMFTPQVALSDPFGPTSGLISGIRVLGPCW